MTDDREDGPELTPEDDAAVSAMLAALPEVEMPADVISRIAAALDEQTPLSGPVPAWAAGGAGNVTVLPSPQERELRSRPARRGLQVLTGVAVGVAAVVGLVVVGTSVLPLGGDTTSGGGTTLAGGGDQAGGGEQAGGQPSGALLTASGTTYTTTDFDAKVAGLVTAAGAPNAPLQRLPVDEPPSQSPAVGPADARALIANLLALDVCVRKLDPDAQSPIAADAGEWNSQQAVVVVLDGTQLARVDAYVVAPACGDAADDDAHLLYYKSVASAN